MARARSGDKPADIRRATVAEIAANGVAGASVNRIAERAGLSVGSIYRYFDSKDALLRAIYLRVKADIHAHLMAAAGGAATSDARLRAVWFAMLAYASDRPDDFLFAETVSPGLALSEAEAGMLGELAAELRGLITAAIADGTLRPAPLHAVTAMLTAPALQMARAATLRGTAPDPAEAEELFDLCWRAVAAS